MMQHDSVKSLAPFFCLRKRKRLASLVTGGIPQLQLLLGVEKCTQAKHGAVTCLRSQPGTTLQDSSIILHDIFWYLLITLYDDHSCPPSTLMYIQLYTLNLQCPGDIVSNTNMACPKVEGNVLPMRYLASPAGCKNLRCHWCHDCVTTGTWEGIPVEDIQIAKARESGGAPQRAPWAAHYL